MACHFLHFFIYNSNMVLPQFLVFTTRIWGPCHRLKDHKSEVVDSCFLWSPYSKPYNWYTYVARQFLSTKNTRASHWIYFLILAISFGLIDKVPWMVDLILVSLWSCDLFLTLVISPQHLANVLYRGPSFLASVWVIVVASFEPPLFVYWWLSLLGPNSICLLPP